MKRELLLVFVAAVALYLPTMRYGFVQDDRAVIASNPAAHSVGAALRAFKDPYWPPAGLYRPIAVLSYAVDWTISAGNAGWMHLMNALWHGLATILLVVVLARWLPSAGAAVAGIVFAWHPVHVEAVASVVGRAELLVAVGILGAVLSARRGKWTLAVLCAALAMFSKEHGVIVGAVMLVDYWLRPPEDRSYPGSLWIVIATVTLAYLVLWFSIGWAGENNAAAVFYGRGTIGRLAIALPAIARAGLLLVWPASLSADYSPQVIPARDAFSFAAFLGLCVILAILALVPWSRRRAPAIGFAAALAVLSYLPASNLFFAAGIPLAERNLYLAVALPAVLVGWATSWIAAQRGTRPALVAATLIALLAGGRSLARLPAWRDNRAQLVTLLMDHPESYRAHASAAAVLAGLHDTTGARREYRLADSLFAGDPYLDAARAIFLIGIGDTAAAIPLIDSRRGSDVGARMTLRAEFLLERARGRATRARAIADSASRRFAGEQRWYLPYLQ